MKKNFYFIWEVGERYLTSNPKSANKQLFRKVYMEEYDEYFNLTRNRFFCTLTDHSALAEMKSGDTVEAELTFDVDEMYRQQVNAKLIKVNGKTI